MRIIVYGVGAVGGVIAAALHHHGQEVVGIARGAQLDAIQTGGLRLRAAAYDFTARLPCVAAPADIDWRAHDAILLCMKTQHTWDALLELRAAGVTKQPIFCVQNGVANERMALRLFPNVHGVTVMLPAQYLTPGEVAVSVQPAFGMFDIGRYPAGLDQADAALADALGRANMAAYPTEHVMHSKYGKLRMNLGNVLQAAIGREARAPEATAALHAEFGAVMAAADQPWVDVSDDPRRMAHIEPAEVAGVARVGGSTTQSLLRGAGSIETDFLNGEVTLMGRLHTVPTPANGNALRLAQHLVSGDTAPGQMSVEQVTSAILDGRLPGVNNCS